MHAWRLFVWAHPLAGKVARTHMLFSILVSDFGFQISDFWVFGLQTIKSHTSNTSIPNSRRLITSVLVTRGQSSSLLRLLLPHQTSWSRTSHLRGSALAEKSNRSAC